MPVLKTRCPACDATVRRTVDEPGEYDLKCPDCGRMFAVETGDEEGDHEERPARGRRDADQRASREPAKTAKKSNSPIVVGAAAGGLVLVLAVVGLAFAFSGKGNKPVAQNSDPPAAKAKPNPPPKQNPNPPKKEPAPAPKADPVEPPPVAPAAPAVPPVRPPVAAPAMSPEGMPEEPAVVPPRPAPADDPFAKAAGFKPDGALPELPPLPPADQRPLLTLDAGGHTALIKHTFFTPDATRVITVSEDKAVRAWDVTTGETVYTVNMPAGADFAGVLFAAALSPDGTQLAVGGSPLNHGKSGYPFYILSTETGELIATVGGVRERVRGLQFSPDGKLIGVGSEAGTLQVYDLTARKWVYQVQAHGNYLDQIRFSPKGGLVATIGHHQDVKIWNLADASGPTARVELFKEKPADVAWTADGATLAVACQNGEVLFHDASGKRTRALAPLQYEKNTIHLERLRFLPGDKQLVFSGVNYRGLAGVVDAATGAMPVLVTEHTNTVAAVDRSADGALAVSSGGEFNETVVWDAKTGEVVRKFHTVSKNLWAVGWSKDGKTLAWGGNTTFDPATELFPLEKTLRLDDYQLGPRPQPGDYTRHVRRDGNLSIKMDDGWRSFTVSENGKELYKHDARGDRLYSISFMPGKGILVGGAWKLYLIDARTGKKIRDYWGDRGMTTALSPSPDGRYFASASTDQVVRVWSPDRDEPVLSIFCVGREWIAWTPQGYYACSPFGERLIAWQVNNGIDKLPSVHPAARFRASLYQPALIKYLIPAGDLKLAMAMAVKFDKEATVATVIADVLPPTVTLTAPPKADAKPVTIRAVAEGNAKNPIVAMRLLVDGRPFDGAAGVKQFDKQAKAEATWQVTFGPGAHTVAVMAESPVSKGMSANATVTRAGAAELPNLYVLAMGISAYPGPLKLNYAASDALLLTRTLQEKSRKVFVKIETKVLTDKEVTKKAMQEGLDWLKSKMTAKDVGVVMFSGHGGRDDESGKFYLIPVDVGRDLDKTCFSGDEFKRRLEDMPGRIVAILDACHSGAVTEIKSGRPDNLVRDLTTEDYGVVVLAASLGTESALESRQTKAGFFTLGLTEGMAGKADYNKDGVIHLNELERYASLRVQQLSRGEQNPTVGHPPNIKPFPIAKP